MKRRDFISLPLISSFAGLPPSLFANERELSREDKAKLKSLDKLEMVLKTTLISDRNKDRVFIYHIGAYRLIYKDKAVYRPVNDKLLIQYGELSGLVIEELYYRIPLESLGFTMKTGNALYKPVWITPGVSEVTINFPEELVRFEIG